MSPGFETHEVSINSSNNNACSHILEISAKEQSSDLQTPIVIPKLNNNLLGFPTKIPDEKRKI